MLLDRYVPHGLDVSNVEYSTYPAGGKYMDLIEYLKRDPDCANMAQLGGHLLARVISRVKHQIY